jgi:predicted O-methyltransferase YrrM
VAITFKDKLLPTQPVLSELFDGTQEQLLDAINNAVHRYGVLEMPATEFVIERSDKVALEEMASSPMTLRFLQSIVRLRKPKRVLEIGTFLGISAMYMAKALEADGKVTTVEKFDHFATLARQNFAANGLADRIRLIEGDAFEVIRGFQKSDRFDLIFLDGNKERYDEYFRMLDGLLDPGGVFITDDVFFHGDALNPEPRTAKGAGVRRFLELTLTYNNYQRAVLPIANGFMLMLKTETKE